MADNKTIIKVQRRTNPYVQIDKSVFEDERLSWKAKGLMGYFLSRPDNWKINIEDLYKRAKDGYDSVKSGLKELKQFYYVSLKSEREKGIIKGWTYTVFEVPSENPEYKPQEENPLEVITSHFEPQEENPLVEKPLEEKPSEVNPQYNNIEFTNEEEERAREVDPLAEFINEETKDLTEAQKQGVIDDFVKSIKNHEKRNEPIQNPIALFYTCLDTYMKKVSSSYWKQLRDNAKEIKQAREEKAKKVANKFHNFTQDKPDFDSLMKLEMQKRLKEYSEKE